MIDFYFDNAQVSLDTLVFSCIIELYIGGIKC